MIIIEYRIPLPLTPDEYSIAFPYSVNRCSVQTTGRTGDPKDEGVEMLLNEPWVDDVHGGICGKHRKKVMHVAARVPNWVRKLVSDNYFMVDEESWVSSQWAETKYKFKLMEKMTCTVRTKHFADRGEQENLLGLTSEELKKRQVVFLDVVSDKLDEKLYKREEDPTLVRSEKKNRGPLKQGWISTADPVMCVYKVVRVDVPLFGFQSMAEKTVQRVAFRDVFLHLHRQLVSWMDDWCDLTEVDIAKMEEEALRRSEEIFGTAKSDRTKAMSIGSDGARGNVDNVSEASTPRSPVIKE